MGNNLTITCYIIAPPQSLGLLSIIIIIIIIIITFHWQFFRSHYGRRVDSAWNRNEYQEYFLGVKAAGT
jgi:hypothetical protein